jgi:hypothetical protein
VATAGFVTETGKPKLRLVLKKSTINIRRFITQNRMPPADAVRIEEFMSYISYNYELPAGVKPLSLHNEIAECPWNSEHLPLAVNYFVYLFDLFEE